MSDEASSGNWSTHVEGATIAYNETDKSVDIQGNGNTFVYDANSINIKNGYYEIDMLVESLNFGIAIRGDETTSDYMMIGYDVSGWSWGSKNGNSWGGLTTTTGVTPKLNERQTYRLEFIDNEYRLLIDGEVVFHETITNDAIPTTDGQIGLRLWGYPNNGQVKVYGVRVGELTEITNPENPEGNEYSTNMSDETSSGNWTTNIEDATIAYNETDKSIDIKGSGNTYLYDASSPSIKNGYYEIDMLVESFNVGIAIRGDASTSDYMMLGYDGSWTWGSKNGNSWGGLSTTTGVTPKLNERQTYRLEFVDNEYRLLIDGEVVLNETITNAAIPTEEGQIGLRLWGYPNNGQVKIYGVRVGELGDIPDVEVPEVKPEEPALGDVYFTFDSADKMGGFIQQDDDSFVSFESQQMTFGKLDDNLERATILSTRSPLVADGYLEADITNRSSGRFGIVMRYADNGNSYIGVAYDVGTWQLITSEGSLYNISGPSWPKDSTKTIRVEYIGSRVKLIVDGVEVFNIKDETLLGEGNDGQIGFVTWGYDKADNQGEITVDNISNGKFNAVDLDPENVFILYDEAGLFDQVIELSHLENRLVQVKNNEEILYDISDINADDYVVVEGSTVTIKKEYIETVKDLGTTTLSFVFEEDFMAEFELQVQAKPDTTVYEYQNNFEDNIDGIQVVSGSANIVHQDGALQVNSGNGIIIDNNIDDLYNLDVEFKFDPNNDYGNFAIVTRYANENDWTAIGTEGAGGNKTTWKLWTGDGQSVELIRDGDRFYADRLVPYTVRIRVLENTLTIWFDDSEVYSATVDAMSSNAGKVGFKYWGNTGATIHELKVNSVSLPTAETKDVEPMFIESDSLKVSLDNNFPRVIDYTYKENNAKAYGQEKPYYMVELDGKQYVPEVSVKEITTDMVIYSMRVEKEEDKLVTFDVKFTVVDNVLKFEIINIDDTQSLIHTINFPTHSLVSLKSTDTNASLVGNSYGLNKVVDITSASATNTYNANTFVVMSSDNIAIGFNTASINNLRGVAYQTIRNGGETSTGIWANGYNYRGLDDEIINNTWSKIAFGTDLNQDGKIDYQDAAIVRRDYAAPDGQDADMLHYEDALRSINTVAMNVGSGAQYPFLRILDNVKKVSLGLDNFPQNIIIKGYNGQGHDSNNGDFANYNEAAGGLDDLNTLLENSAEYNTSIGVHINHTEVYPESIMYGPLHSTIGGWSWYDSSTQIKRENDILAEENSMGDRIEQLYQDTNGLLSSIYVDVYFGNRWPMYELANEINSRGMAVSTEYVNEFNTSSVWAHHVGNAMDSEVGNLARFINHEYQDIWGGTNLFRNSGSRSDLGINGWQTSYTYSDTISAFYTSILPNKFLAQYPIMQYESSDQVILGDELNVVSKMENGQNVITLDNKVIAKGNQIFIPWSEDGQDKIYHYNNNGGNTTWELPNTYAGQTTIKVFELSDQGRIAVDIIEVKDNQVTINAKANVGYVIYKGDSNIELTDITTYQWSEGSYISDQGFDSYTEDYAWQVSENAEFIANNNGNTELVIKGTEEGFAKQTITGLTPGTSYAVTVWTSVSDGRTSTIKVTTPDGQEVSNYVDYTDVLHGLHHTSKYKTYLQQIQVNFVATTTNAELELLAGIGNDNNSFVVYDDVRIVENTPSDLQGHTYFEDFENVEEGYGAFLTTEADNSHLSQRNDPWTNDVVEGEFSLKVRYGNYMRTAPSTVRLEPNTTYTAGIDYIAWANNAFTFAVKSRDGLITIASVDCGSPNGSIQSAEISFTTGDEEGYYFEIVKNQASDYVIDNFFVDMEVEIDKSKLEELYDEANLISANDYTPESFIKLNSAISYANSIINNLEATDEEITQAYERLEAAIDSLVAYATSIDKENLANVINEMKELSLEFFVEDENWEELQTKISEAEALILAEKVTKPDIKETIKVLYQAKDNLVSKINKEELYTLYNLAINVDTADVVDGKEAVAFTSALPLAKEALDSTSSTQAEVDEAFEILEAAYKGIVPKPEASIREDFDEIITKANNINESLYTADELDKINNLLAITPKKWHEFDTVINGLNNLIKDEEDLNSDAEAVQRAKDLIQDGEVFILDSAQTAEDKLKAVQEYVNSKISDTGVKTIVTHVKDNIYLVDISKNDAHDSKEITMTITITKDLEIVLVNDAKVKIDSAKYPLPTASSDYASKDTLDKYVLDLASNAVANKKIIISISESEYIVPIHGTKENPDGVNGLYRIILKVGSSETDYTTLSKEIMIVIPANDYKAPPIIEEDKTPTPTPTSTTNTLRPTPSVETVKNEVEVLEDNNTFIFKVDGDIDDILGLYVNGELIDSSNYTISNDSQTITLNTAYIETLSAGKYSIDVEFNDGRSSVVIEINDLEVDEEDIVVEEPKDEITSEDIEDLNTPTTGGSNNTIMYIIIGLLSLIGIALIFIKVRKTKI